MSSWGTSFGSAGLSAMQVYDDVFVPRLFVPWQFASTLAASRIAAELEALTSEQQAELVRALAAHAAPLTVDGAIHSPTASNLAFARRR